MCLHATAAVNGLAVQSVTATGFTTLKHVATRNPFKFETRIGFFHPPSLFVLSWLRRSTKADAQPGSTVCSQTVQGCQVDMVHLVKLKREEERRLRNPLGYSFACWSSPLCVLSSLLRHATRNQ
jgi:hypothetical protein